MIDTSRLFKLSRHRHWCQILPPRKMCSISKSLSSFGVISMIEGDHGESGGEQFYLASDSHSISAIQQYSSVNIKYKRQKTITLLLLKGMGKIARENLRSAPHTFFFSKSRHICNIEFQLLFLLQQPVL